ncbi:MAG: hypothetical protein R3F53_27345 [Gammaproteobacteria bacterium]
MRRFVLAIGLLLSSVVNAQTLEDRECNFDRVLEGRPLWYTDDLRLALWLVESQGEIVGHLQDSESGKWYYIDVRLFPEGCGGQVTVYEPVYENGVVNLIEKSDLRLAPDHDVEIVGGFLLALRADTGLPSISYYRGSTVPFGGLDLIPF